jgi:hypothetical protein
VLALPGVEKPFLISIAPLSFAVLTTLLGVRLGRKSFESGATYVGPVSAVATFGVLTIAVALSSNHPSVMPTMWMAFSFPTLLYALGVFIGGRADISRFGSQAKKVQQKVRTWALDASVELKSVFRFSLRSSLMAIFAIATFSAITFALLLIVNFATVLGIYEGLQGGGGGSLILTVAQVLFMPNFVLWVFSWFVGTGFAIGTGSSVSPLGTDLGLVPALPVLGAIPPGQFSFGLIAVIIPIAASFVSAFVMWPALSKGIGNTHRMRWLALAVFGAAVIGGLITMGLMWASSGSAGPGRLAQVGPDPIMTGLVIAAEFLIASTLGLWAASQTSSRSTAKAQSSPKTSQP